MSKINEAAYLAFSTNSGTTGTLNEVTYAYMSQISGHTGTYPEVWDAAFQAQGFENEIAYWRALGYTGTYNEMYYKWLTIGSGAFGPNVVIQRNNDPGVCFFEPPITDDCAASETYTANETGFTTNTWL